METLTKEQQTKKSQLVDIGKGIKAGIINITPEQAEKMLEHNNHNRGVKRGKISQYALDMTDGLWQMNGVPIIFNHNGELLDGQNRLHAIIRSGIACEILVVTGITRQAFQTIDTGQKRNGGDVLTVTGVPVRKANKLSSLISRIHKDNIGYTGTAWTRGMVTSGARFTKQREIATNQMVVEYYKTHQQELDEVYDFAVQHESKIIKLIPFAMYLFIFYKLRRINLIQAEEFCSRLATGDMLSNEDPIYHLREKLIGLRSSDTEKAPGWHYAAYTYKAWNAYRKGNPMKKLFIAYSETSPVKPI